MKSLETQFAELYARLEEAGIAKEANKLVAKATVNSVKPTLETQIAIANKVCVEARGGKFGAAARKALLQESVEITERAPVRRNNGAVIFDESAREQEFKERSTRLTRKLMGLTELQIKQLEEADGVPAVVSEGGEYSIRVYRVMKSAGLSEKECVAHAKASSITETSRRDLFRF